MKRIGILTAGGDGPLTGAPAPARNLRQTQIAAENLAQPYHSINTDVHQCLRYLEMEAA